MERANTYTEQSHPNHRAVKALLKKGYRGFIVNWYPAISRNRGYSLTLSDNTFLRGYDLANLIDKINALPQK